jgi:hypothetical protein
MISGALITGLWLFAMMPNPAPGATIAGRNVPSPIYGVTLDDVSNTTAKVNSLSQMVHPPTARIVFDPGVLPSYYLKRIQQFRNVAYIMGQLADSSYMTEYTVSSIVTWAENYTGMLGSLVDIWEIGNEINGNWLSTLSDGSDVLPKMEAMFDGVFSKGGQTALTFFYEGEPSDPNNCIATDHGGNDMFTWITNNFQLNLPPNERPASTENIRLNVNYVLISWYPDQCPGQNPNWPWVFTKLASIFPNSNVGFGELGTVDPQYGSPFEISLISEYYSMAKILPSLPASYIGGYFWWYFAEEMVPWGSLLSSTLNAAIQ